VLVRYFPAAQEVHEEAPAALQVAQVESQGPQTPEFAEVIEVPVPQGQALLERGYPVVVTPQYVFVKGVASFKKVRMISRKPRDSLFEASSAWLTIFKRRVSAVCGIVR